MDNITKSHEKQPIREARGLFPPDAKRFVFYTGCGFGVTTVYSSGRQGKRRIWRCNRWDCICCARHKAKTEARRNKDAFNQYNPKGTQVYAAFVPGTREHIEHFITTDARLNGNPWSRIYAESKGRQGAWIIAQRKFTGAVRRNRKKFFEETLPDDLMQPWKRVGNENRISHSSEFRKYFPKSKPREPDPGVTANLMDNEIRRWKELATDEERAEFLAEISPRRLGVDGRRIIKDCLHTNDEGRQN